MGIVICESAAVHCNHEWFSLCSYERAEYHICSACSARMIRCDNLFALEQNEWEWLQGEPAPDISWWWIGLAVSIVFALGYFMGWWL